MSRITPMERVPIPEFTYLSDEEQLQIVSSVQEKRTLTWKEALKQPVRKTRKKPKKNGTKSLKSEDDLSKLLAKMSPEQLEMFKKKMGL